VCKGDVGRDGGSSGDGEVDRSSCSCKRVRSGVEGRNMGIGHIVLSDMNDLVDDDDVEDLEGGSSISSGKRGLVGVGGKEYGGSINNFDGASIRPQLDDKSVSCNATDMPLITMLQNWMATNKIRDETTNESFSHREWFMSLFPFLLAFLPQTILQISPKHPRFEITKPTLLLELLPLLLSLLPLLLLLLLLLPRVSSSGL
jgi:hypothetical protein